jgi:uncharacterized membrane protein
MLNSFRLTNVFSKLWAYNYSVKKFLVLIIALLLFFITPTTTFAEESIKNFQAKIIAHQNGDMTITEKIVYDFGEGDRHGIFRFIPTYTRLKDVDLYRISEIVFTNIKRDGDEEKYETDYASDKVEVKIGDPDKTITGAHTYEITYLVKNGIASNFDDHDEIYWNITGNEWKVPIETIEVRIENESQLPDNNNGPTKALCFTGESGSQEQNCTTEINGKTALIRTKKVLNPYEGLTTVVAYPVATFPKSQLSDSPPMWDPDFINFLKIYGVIWAILNLLVAPFIWQKYQDKKNHINLGAPNVNFDIPKGDDGKIITPMEAGIIDNTKLEQNDVMATIFDLAIKKVIKIEEIKKKKTLGIFGGDSEYKLVRLNDDESKLTEFEKTLMNKLFSGGIKDVNLKDIKTFYLTFQKLEKESFQSLIERGFYTKNPKDQKAGLLVFGLIALCTLNIILGPLLLYLSTQLNGRTKLGDKMDWQVEGLKIFLKNMKRHYNFQAKNAITVEKYIPYAMAFGFIDEFMEELKDMYPEYKPTWYSGHSNFYVMNNAFTSSMSGSFTTSAPSSSSGFSGGGSSGGGGGGGGGGSW